MKKIVILGAGAMGSAFSVPCITNNNNVKIFGTHLEDDFIKKIIKNNNYHPSLNINISKKVKFYKYSYLNREILNEQDLIVIAVNSKGIEWTVNELTKHLHDSKLPHLLLLTKGLSIHNNRYEVLVEKMKRLLIKKNFKKIDITAVAGPCLAGGLANKVHSSVIFANNNIKIANYLKKDIETDFYHISTSTDIIGVEVCAAIKNIYSMIIGASKEISNTVLDKKIKEKNYFNTSAALIKQSLNEMEIIVRHLKGNKKTVYGLAGLGDLYVSSIGGRNSLMGSYIGSGLTYSEAKKNKMKNITVEGAELAFEIGRYIKKDFNKKTMPLMMSMLDVLINDKKLKINWNNFE